MRGCKAWARIPGYRTLTGTYAEVWIDGELVAEAKKVELKVTANREDVQLGLDVDSKLTGRAVNEGFSGGEKKKNEIFQMAMLEPELAILDETDSGLDIDALRIVAQGVKQAAHAPERHRRDNALPTAARLHRARFRACAL